MQKTIFGRKPEYSIEEYQKQIKTEINANVIPKHEVGKTPIIMLRNSRTAVKRAKKEHKLSFNFK